MEDIEKIKIVFEPQISEGNIKNQIDALSEYFEFTAEDKAKLRLSMSPRHIGDTIKDKKLPIVHYCWDFYKWAYEDKGRHYKDHKQYADELAKCDLIIVPSTTQQKRLKELFGFDSVVVHSGFTPYKHEIRDDGFILDPLREYPEENSGWAKKAAKELGIPFLHTEHQFSKEKFEKLVCSCTFLTSCYREASTGALTLMEGLWNGKPSLISNSPYQGANEYVGKYATTFQYDNYEDLKLKMKEMWKNRKTVDINEAREYLKDFSYDSMAKKLYEICKSI